MFLLRVLRKPQAFIILLRYFITFARPRKEHRYAVRVLVSSTAKATHDHGLLQLFQNFSTRFLHVFHNICRVAAEFVRDSATLLVQQLTEVPEINILVVHVRLTLPMHLQDHSLHLPVDSSGLVFKASKENLRELVEG